MKFTFAEESVYISTVARESAFIADICASYARGTRSNKAEPGGGNGRASLGSRGIGDRAANGRLQVQPVYIARTTDSKRSMADARANAAAYTTDKAKPINFPFNSQGPVFRILASTYSPCSLHSDSRGSVSRRYSVSWILRLIPLLLTFPRSEASRLV